MKALILVGGYGTRLRPLTFSCPKPCVEFANMPILEHQILALVQAGVTEVVLAINYQPEAMHEIQSRLIAKYNINIICSQEVVPLGTAGPIAAARDILLSKGTGESYFFVLNSDIICDYPFVEMVNFHKSHGKQGTIVVTPVDDPTKYGVVVSNDAFEVISFIEKPKKFISNKINAGLYLFSSSVLDRIENKPTSIEREIFPLIAKDRELCSFTLQGFWMDIGQPKDYLLGLELYLEFLGKKSPEKIAKGTLFTGNVLVDQDSLIGEGCLIGPNVCIGPGVKIESGARIANTVILAGSQIGAHSWIKGSIIGWRSKIGKWVRIEGLTVLGENVQVKDEVCLNAIIVLPHKEVKESEMEKGKILL
jgi:mannose-1-phosphate guanylyltransferase